MGLDLLTRLCNRAADGSYALSLSRQEAVTAVQCAFAEPADAERIARLLQAAPADDGGRWASVWQVLLDQEAEGKALAVAGHPAKRHGRKPTAEPL